MRGSLLILIGFMFVASSVWAQDPVSADPKHYKVEFENDQVRVLRVTYGPHEKGAVHDRAAGVAVFLTGSHSKVTEGDKSRERKAKAGTTRWLDAGNDVQIENL